jgi:hypothetical protein
MVAKRGLMAGAWRLGMINHWLRIAQHKLLRMLSILRRSLVCVEGGRLGLMAHRFVIGSGLGSKPPQAE